LKLEPLRAGKPHPSAKGEGSACDEYHVEHNHRRVLTHEDSRCRFKINKQYFERKEFPRKKAEDIIGGADAWKNVDKMDGSSLHFPCLPYIPSSSFFLFSNLLFPKKTRGAMISTSHDAITNTQNPTAQCPNTNCGNHEAFFRQVQIRSADGLLYPSYLHLHPSDFSKNLTI